MGDHYGEYLAIWIVFGTLAMVAITLRFVVRIFVVRQFGWDDWMMVVAAVWNIILLAAGFLQSHYGMGRHIMSLTPDNATEAIKWQILGIPIAGFSMVFVKLSLCLLLIRLGISNVWKWILISLIGLYCLDTIIDTIVFLHRCSPIESMWNMHIASVCHYSIPAVNISHYIQAGLALATDILLSLAPALMLWKLKMQVGTKILLIGLFCMGLLSTLCAILKVVLTTTVTEASLKDFTYAIAPVSWWAFLECEVSIIAACIPSIRALFTKSSFFQSSTGRSKYAYGARSNNSHVETKDIQVVTQVEWASDAASENGREQESV